MFVIQKNAPELSNDLVDIMDGALLEGAFYNNYENSFKNYINKGKIVLNTEYTDNINKNKFNDIVCKKSYNLGYITILKNRDLDDFILSCKVKNKYIVTENDNILINKFIDKILILSKKKNINLEVLINKIEINIGKKELSERLNIILNEIIKGLKQEVIKNN